MHEESARGEVSREVVEWLRGLAAAREFVQRGAQLRGQPLGELLVARDLRGGVARQPARVVRHNAAQALRRLVKALPRKEHSF